MSRDLNAALIADAERILAENGLPCGRVIAIDRDSILYVNKQAKARTAWLDQPEGGTLRVEMVVGFAAIEPAGWHCGQVNYGLSGGRA
jgi:hypothetical protein